MGSATGDDLEITSIGSLYRGQWQKKYWSSSRGKDRYPYPVGYHAIRTHAGSTYRMEIHEGLKGPKFVVTSTDGESCTGQTPDIAWESFQKKSCPRVKNWHGKRFSSKIDGVELFGFRNPFVQRLLRELVANINGMTERSVLSHSCSRLPKLDDKLRIQESRAHPNLLPYLEKQQITGKRSTKNRSSVKYPIKEARVKRIRHPGLLNDAGGSTSKQRSRLSPSAEDSTIVHVQDENKSPLKDSVEIQVSSTPINKSITASMNNETLHPKCQNGDDGNEHTMPTKDCYGNEDQGLEVKASVVFKENSDCFVPVDKIVLPEHSKCLVEEHTISSKQSSLIRHGNSPLSCADNVLLEKSSYAAREQGDSLLPPKDADIVDMGHMTRYSGVYVADTCETAKDEAVSSPSRIEKGDLCSMQNDLFGGPVLTSSAYCAPSFQSSSMPEELPKNSKLDILKSMNPLPEEVLNHVSCTAGDTMLKELVKDSFPEVGSSSGSSNTSTEKMDLDLAGQELARSMMTFLLPRAVPLLKNTYVKRRSRHQSRETKNGSCSKSSYSISSEQNKSDHLSDAKCQGRDTGKMLDQGPKENFEGKINVTRLFSGSDSLSQVNRLDHPSIRCMATEPIPRNSKDVKSVIPDSFEEEQCEFDTATKCQSLSGVDIAAPDRIIDNISFSRLTGANSEGVKNVSNCLTGNDACIGEVMLTDGPEKGEDWLSDSVLACVDPDECIALKQEPTDDCLEQIEKCTDKMPFLDPQVMHTDSEHLNAGCINNAEEEIRGQKDLIQYHPLKSENTESFEQYLPSINNLADSEVPKSNMILSHMIYCKGKEQSYSLHEQETYDDNAHTSFRDDDEKGVRAHMLKVGLDEKEETTMEGESMFCLPRDILPTDGLHFQRHKVGIIAHSPESSKRNNTPLSEIIICRQKDTITTNMHFPQEVTGGMENGKEKLTSTKVDFKILFNHEVEINGLHHNLKTVGNVSAAERSMFPAPNASQNQDIMENDTEEMKSSKYLSFASSSKECVVAVTELSAPARSCIPLQEQVKDLSDDKKDHTHGVLPSSDMDLLIKSTSNNGSKDLSHSQMYQKSYLDGASSEKENSTTGISSIELLGCYLHPNPVLSILVTSKEDGLQICVMCGLVEVNIRNLFIYMVPTQDEGGDCPFFLGYTLLLLPLPKDQSNGNIPFERYGLQFTPDGQSLVYPNSIKAPRCRQQDIDCSCKNCKSDYCEENTVEIVHVKFGYVSSVAKLTPAERVSCILVCEPNYLIAVGESGKLHVWIMNLEWSAHLEEFMLPNCHALSSTIFELKRIPSSNSIIGHNGLGDFGIWDISKRVILARFSYPGSTTFQILPLGLFNLHGMDNLATVSRMEEHIKETIPISDNCCPKTGEDPFLALSAKEMAVWFLVSAVLGSDVQHQREKPNMSPFGWWRLALFMKNEVVMGSILDHRISAITASADYGIYGTCDGFLCKWELSTGEKVANIHPFKRGSISSIAVDPKSGALAVASDDGQLKVYLQPQI